jgi:hypothetical protein
MAHRQPQRLGPFVYRHWPGFLAPPGRPRRLAIDGGNVVPGGRKRIQRWHGKPWRSHEDDAHGDGPTACKSTYQRGAGGAIGQADTHRWHLPGASGEDGSITAGL